MAPRRKKNQSRTAALVEALGALGCPGFPVPEEAPSYDPAVVLVAALACEELDQHMLEALPWLALEHCHLDWDWAIRECRARRAQNRLGYIVSLALRLGASSGGNEKKLVLLSDVEERLFDIRLDTEDTLCHQSIDEAERKALRDSRPREAALWNLLTDFRIDPRHARPRPEIVQLSLFEGTIQ
jgi:hypothetical protein